MQLHPFEVSSLASLVSADGAEPEEAIAWIASLVRFEEDDIAIAINVVSNAKRNIIRIA